MPIMQLDRSATTKECNMKKVKHENGGKSEIWKKSAQEQCTRVHKWIAGRPLTERYRLVVSIQLKLPMFYFNERDILEESFTAAL